MDSALPLKKEKLDPGYPWESAGKFFFTNTDARTLMPEHDVRVSGAEAQAHMFFQNS